LLLLHCDVEHLSGVLSVSVQKLIACFVLHKNDSGILIRHLCLRQVLSSSIHLDFDLHLAFTAICAMYLFLVYHEREGDIFPFPLDTCVLILLDLEGGCDIFALYGAWQLPQFLCCFFVFFTIFIFFFCAPLFLFFLDQSIKVQLIIKVHINFLHFTFRCIYSRQSLVSQTEICMGYSNPPSPRCVSDNYCGMIPFSLKFSLIFLLICNFVKTSLLLSAPI